MNSLPIENLSPEQSLLLCAVRSAISVNHSTVKPAVVSDSLDWAIVADEAAYHRIVPQLCWWLESVGSDMAPLAVVDSLRRTCRGNLVNNLRLTGELFTLLELLAAQGIQATPFKGPSLADLAGGDLSWRSFCDLDLLLDRRDVAVASNLLRARGYKLNLDWAATQDHRFLDVTYALEFFGGPNEVMVELHWALFPRYLGFNFEFAELRRRLVPVSPGGKPMQTLGPDDLLLYLCAHGAKHFWANLNSVVDVARLIASRDDWQWETLLTLAQQRKVERTTLLGLLLAQGLLGAPVPDWIVEQAAQDKSLLRLTEATVAEMFFPKQQEGGMQRQFRYFFQLQQGWRAKLLYLLRVVAAPNVGDWEFQPLPHKWTVLYLVLRPIRLLKKYLSF